MLDKALAARQAAGQPITVGIVGAGSMGTALARQLLLPVPGIRLVAISNRTLGKAMSACEQSGLTHTAVVTSAQELDSLQKPGTVCISNSSEALCEANCLDVIVEVTGTVEYAAAVAVRAIEQRKHLVLMNAELDATLGPILKVMADRQGVVVTNIDGDQPGVVLNLVRQIKSMGFTPVMCGNIKGMQDAYRTPLTQKAWAEKWNQTPHMVTSFADGSKISFEQTITANATGMRVACRGMYGPTVEPGTSIEQASEWFPDDIIDSPTGIVDYVVGASPGPGVFVLGKLPVADALRQTYLDLYKLGKGPLYCFYTPFHLCFMEVPNTIGRAAIFADAAVTAEFGAVVDTVATAKRDLLAGETLDGIGFFMTYGQCENADVAYRDQLLPMGLAEGCTLLRNIKKDQVITYKDVTTPANRVAHSLRATQDQHFFGKA